MEKTTSAAEIAVQNMREKKAQEAKDRELAELEVGGWMGGLVGWVGGWVGWIEENEAVGMSYCELGVGGG